MPEFDSSTQSPDLDGKKTKDSKSESMKSAGRCLLYIGGLIFIIWLSILFIDWFAGPMYSNNPDSSGFLSQYIVPFVIHLATFVGSNPTASGFVALISLVLAVLGFTGTNNTKKKD